MSLSAIATLYVVISTKVFYMQLGWPKEKEDRVRISCTFKLARQATVPEIPSSTPPLKGHEM